MKNILYLSVVLFALLQSTLAYACSLTEIEPLQKGCYDPDGGTRPNAACTATIVAPEGKFILASTIKATYTGADHQVESKVSHTPHADYADEIVSSMILSQVSNWSRCEHRNRTGTSRCAAAAQVAAISYPLTCVPEMLQDVLNDLLKN